MKCELCSSGHREPERKLCQPCSEAVARLWNMVQQEFQSSAYAPVGEATQAGSAPKTVRQPYALL